MHRDTRAGGFVRDTGGFVRDTDGFVRDTSRRAARWPSGATAA
jgi:hypothetical protein